MAVVVTCCHCKEPLPSWPIDRCPHCARDPHTADDSPTADWVVPPELRAGWSDPDNVEE